MAMRAWETSGPKGEDAPYLALLACCGWNPDPCAAGRCSWPAGGLNDGPTISTGPFVECEGSLREAGK